MCGQKYQWNEILLNSIVAELEKNDITYWISDRYKIDYDFEDLNFIIKTNTKSQKDIEDFER